MLPEKTFPARRRRHFAAFHSLSRAVNMRAVHTLGSTHLKRGWVSPACLAFSGTFAGLASVLISVTHPPPCAPFAPPSLQGFFATMGALTPAWRALRTLTHHELPLGSIQVSLLNVPELQTPPSPTTLQSPIAALTRYPSARLISPFFRFSFPTFSGLGFAFTPQARQSCPAESSSSSYS